MMKNPRLLLWIALGLVLWLNYQAWLKDYALQATPAAMIPLQTSAKPSRDLSADIPKPASVSMEAAHSAEPAAAESEIEPSSKAQQVIHVRTDVLDLDISQQGGTLQRVDLVRYPKVKGGQEPVRLMNQDSPETRYVLESGLTGPTGLSYPTHLAEFTALQQEFTLSTAPELRVPLEWSDGKGVEVTKTYIFRRGQYRIDIEYAVRNRSGALWQAAPYAQIERTDPIVKSSMFDVQSRAFRGPAMWDGAKYRKLKINDADDRHLAQEVSNGWVAALQHHFVGAIVPPADAKWRFTLSAEDLKYRLAAAGPAIPVTDGSDSTLNQTLYIGPKLQLQLNAISPELGRVADYGMLTLLSRPLFWLLEKVHSLLGNWGLAIVIVTFLLKLLFYPLSEASGKSMAKMKMLAPRIKNLQESHKDDREKLGHAMMELYKREKVNPVAGCLPIIIQIPVFLAFYWVLLESVEMRQAPFMGWINDLSSRDPLFILPAIMAAAMFIQYKLNPTPPDPVQAKVFMFMPLAMSVMFAFFPAGLVLYWVTNTVLSIAQQWNINRRIEAGKKS
jgi:YidC/Oxa1 family membrane protein insertase